MAASFVSHLSSLPDVLPAVLYGPPSFALYRQGRHLPADQFMSLQFSRVPQSAASHVCRARLTKKEREAAAQAALHADETRPWNFEIPSLEEILETPAWPEKVSTPG